MSHDCEKPRRMQCRNCDEYGHSSRECPLPEDCKFIPIQVGCRLTDRIVVSKFKCNNCGEMGHKKMQCTNPTQGDVDGGGGYGHGGNDGGFGNAGDNEGFGNAGGSGNTDGMSW